MNKKIIINSTLNDVRVAITENEKLTEFFIELPDKEKFIGNIYLGKVNRIVQGINAAFIDIGLNQDAFLHFSDIDESLEDNFISEEDDDLDFDENDENQDNKKKDQNFDFNLKKSGDIALRKTNAIGVNDKNQPTFKTKKSGNIKINLKPGQEILVQVVREAYGNKGVKVTSKIALPGRYCVLMPFESLVGISRKIHSHQERRRLRYIAKNSLPEGFGCIIRTVSQGKSDEELRRDWEMLLSTWREIEARVKQIKEPGLVYQDMLLAASIIRDLFNSEIEKVIVDSKKLYKEIAQYLKKVSPALIKKVQHYNGTLPIFETFGIEDALNSTLKRKLPLPSGGSIVIDQTEAMMVIDVNSGRATEKEQELNALKTNLEAVKEIALQARLRDLGGMIVIDFIDMAKESNKKKMFNEMRRELSRDRAKTVVYPVTQLGLIQMTRQRINQNIDEKTSEVCPMCKGKGRITSKTVLSNAIERWLKNFRSGSREFRLNLMVHPDMAEYLTEGTITRISRLMIKYFVKITIQQNLNVAIDEFKFHSVRRQVDITKEYL